MVPLRKSLHRFVVFDFVIFPIRAARAQVAKLACGVVVRAFVLRFIPAVLPALLLCACFRDSYVSPTASTVSSGHWRIEQQPDRVTGTPIGSALLTTMGSNSGVDFPQPATLQLACFMDMPVVSFRFDFKIGTNLNSFLGYRFDEKPGHEIGARFVANAQAVLIEEPAEVAQFVSELATSNVLYIRIRSFNAGRSAAEFKVDGAHAAIASAFARCPVMPPAPSPQQATPPARKRSV